MKKGIIITLLVFLNTLVSAQRYGKYSIMGEVQGIPDNTIVDLFERKGQSGQRIATDSIVKGRFRFSDTLSSKLATMSIFLRDQKKFAGAVDLWVDDKPIKITGKGKYLSAWAVDSVNKNQIIENEFNRRTRHLRIQSDSIGLLIKDRETYNKYKEKRSSMWKEMSLIDFETIKEDPNNDVAIEELHATVKYGKDVNEEQIRAVYDKLTLEYKNTFYGRSILELLKTSNDQPLKVGDKMLDFKGTDTTGKVYELNEFKGKYILLDFWGMGCGPCVKSIPETRLLQSQNQSVLKVVSISQDTNKERWIAFSKKKNINWTNLFDEKTAFAGVSKRYGVRGIPNYLLISPEGEILDKWMGYYGPDTFKEKLSKYIKEIKL